MSIVKRAICWDGVYANIALYALYDGVPNVESCSFESDEVKPVKVFRPLLLEDELGTVPGGSLVNYEIRLASFPGDFPSYLTFCSKTISARGAAFIWFQFEASFHFDHLLTRDVARQIYYITDRQGRCYSAIDDAELTGESWRDLVLEKKSELFAGG